MSRIPHWSVVLYAINLAIICLLVGFTPGAAAADLTAKEVETVLQESMTALLTGQEFPPALQKQQQILRNMFEKGTVTRDEIITMQEKMFLPILSHHRTSRYILKDMPRRVEALLAPYMTWEEVKAIVWKASSTLIPDGEQMVITLGTLAPSGTPWIKVPEETLIPRMAKLSNNKFVVKVYSGGIMGEDTDILRKMDIGQLDGCGCTAIGLVAASPDVSVLLLPGLFRNYDEVDYITEKFRKRIDASFEQRGYILSSFIDTGNFYVFTKNKITGLADLPKQKFLTTFGDIEIALYKELGVDATPMAAPETISVLSTGMANAMMAPAGWMLGIQAYQYMGYYIKPPFLYSPGAALTSVQTKERLRKRFGVSELLADNFQEMLVYEVSTLEAEWKQIARDFETRSLQAFETKCGIKPVNLSPADLKTLETASLRVREQLAGKAFSKDLMDDILKALEAYRAKK
ncbi:MAG: TRAP transporter substrate-binding protein DctP [Thermodesulfobacteriota bacterium]